MAEGYEDPTYLPRVTLKLEPVSGLCNERASGVRVVACREDGSSEVLYTWLSDGSHGLTIRTNDDKEQFGDKRAGVFNLKGHHGT